jgi:cell division septal protein FtsQ
MKPVPRHKLYTPPSSLKRRGNPYFKNKGQDRFGATPVKNTLARLSPKFWLWFFIIVVIGLVLFWLLLLSNVFLVKNIEVKGTSLVSSSDVQQLAEDHLAKHRLLVFSESRLMVFNANVLKKELNDRYSLDSVKVVKKIPSTIMITISEKNPAAVWFEADTYQEIDAAGWILASVSGSVEGLPTIYNNGEAKINNKKVNNEETAIALAKALNAEFANRFSNIKIKQLIVTNDQNTLTLVPIKGALIYFSTIDTYNSQLDRLDILLKAELKGRFEKMHYIDLRFGSKVYYQ